MKRVRYIAGLAGLAPAAAGVLTGTAAHAAPAAGGAPSHDASARAKTVSLHPLPTRGVTVNITYSCYYKNGYASHCNASIIHGGALVWSANGQVIFSLSDGNRVKVTCWYKGSYSIVYDHVVREHVNNTFFYYVGHVDDYHVNFGGLSPKSLGLRHC